MWTKDELEEYDIYLKGVKARIVELNKMCDKIILISQVEINVVKPARSKRDFWEFEYEIRDMSEFGMITAPDYNTWKREKQAKERDEKLKLLGIE